MQLDACDRRVVVGVVALAAVGIVAVAVFPKAAAAAAGGGAAAVGVMLLKSSLSFLPLG